MRLLSLGKANIHFKSSFLDNVRYLREYLATLSRGILQQKGIEVVRRPNEAPSVRFTSSKALVEQLSHFTTWGNNDRE